MTAPRHALDESFGRLAVPPQERRHRIRRMFDAIAPRYDLMNDLMSLGIHRLWKHRLAKRCEGITGFVVDLAGGTGDVARRLVSADRHVIVCDPGIEMMKVGASKSVPPGAESLRMLGAGGTAPIHWIAGEAEALPFASDSVDLLTISFGIRNVTQLAAALSEIHRVIKPGGRFVCLEFSRPAWWLAPFYDLYSWLVIPRLGAAVARAPGAYQYLVESIRRFPDQREFAELLAAAGFHDVHWENLSFGIACLHFGAKAV